MRALVGALGGVVHESALVLLLCFVRQSRLYEATAKNALRIAIEAVGRVAPREPPEVSAKEITKRKAAGNVVELGSIAAFGFSPSGCSRRPRTSPMAPASTSPRSSTS